MSNIAKNKNHRTTSNSVTVESTRVSRGRVRIPTRLLRHVGIKPGDRVKISINELLNDVEVKPKAGGSHKVEKDGSVRFSARKFGVANGAIFCQAESAEDKYVLIF